MKHKIIAESHAKGIPVFSMAVLILILLGCLLADVISSPDPGYLHIYNILERPGRAWIFGTDNLGRDIWSCIWHGGRISIAIGIISSLISTLLAIIYGAISGMASKTADAVMMRVLEIILSIPQLLIIMLAMGFIGRANVLTMSLVIGLTGWFSIAKVVRMQVRQIRNSDFILIADAMGGSFAHILKNHLVPEFVPSIMYMVVMNIRSAIVAESTFSFIGLGLPVGTVSWGSMLSLADEALLSGAWWIIVIPGVFLVALLVSITDIGNWYRQVNTRKASNL